MKLNRIKASDFHERRMLITKVDYKVIFNSLATSALEQGGSWLEIAKDEENNLYIKIHSKFHDDFFKLNRSGSSFYLGKFNPIYLNFEPKDKIVIGEPDENGFRKLTRLDENA